MHVHVFWNDDVSAVENPLSTFGFKPRSKQDNFLRGPSGPRMRKVAAVVSTSAQPPSGFDDPRVVAHCFGAVLLSSRDNALEVWHVGTSSHALNHTAGGTRWGAFSLTRHDETSKVYWTSRGTRVTRATFQKLVHGTPNPYACKTLAALVAACNVRTVQQNSDLPCAKLFNSEYSHATHPATSLIYRALGFQFAAEGFVWNGSPDNLSHRWQRLVDTRLARGKPCV